MSVQVYIIYLQLMSLCYHDLKQHFDAHVLRRRTFWPNILYHVLWSSRETCPTLAPPRPQLSCAAGAHGQESLSLSSPRRRQVACSDDALGTCCKCRGAGLTRPLALRDPEWLATRRSSSVRPPVRPPVRPTLHLSAGRSVDRSGPPYLTIHVISHLSLPDPMPRPLGPRLAAAAAAAVADLQLLDGSMDAALPREPLSFRDGHSVIICQENPTHPV